MNPACTELLLLGFSTNLYRGLTREIKDQLAWAQQREALPSLKCLFLSVYVLLVERCTPLAFRNWEGLGKGSSGHTHATLIPVGIVLTCQPVNA